MLLVAAFAAGLACVHSVQHLLLAAAAAAGVAYVQLHDVELGCLLQLSPAELTCIFFAALAAGKAGSAGLGNSLALSTTVDSTVADAASTVRSMLSNACFKRSIVVCDYGMFSARCWSLEACR